MGRIGVGDDGSPGSQRALEWAVDEAARRGATVEAVHAWSFPYATTTPFGPVVIDSGTLEQVAQQELDEAVSGVDASKLAAPIEKILVCGGAGGVLLDHAKGADLLVVGTRGRGGFTGLLLGSVSQQVAHHAPCPVVIVPSDED
jgi:nucleotide-binding universal stress UspA family protein